MKLVDEVICADRCIDVLLLSVVVLVEVRHVFLTSGLTIQQPKSGKYPSDEIRKSFLPWLMSFWSLTLDQINSQERNQISLKSYRSEIK